MKPFTLPLLSYKLTINASIRGWEPAVAGSIAERVGLPISFRAVYASNRSAVEQFM
jgi:hypothetical protein